MSLFRKYFRSTIAWAMLPLAVWSGLPAAGCFCADGSFSLTCGGCLTPSGGERQGALGCSCCADGRSTSGCGGVHAACCPDSNDGDNRRSGENGCCTPVESSPAIASSAWSDGFAAVQIAVVNDSIVSVVAEVASPISAAFNERDPVPMCDRVILLSRLVI